MGGKVNKNYAGGICRENFKLKLFRSFFDNFFALRQKHKDEVNDLMQGLV